MKHWGEGSCLNVVHVVVVTANDRTAFETHHEGTRSSSKASTRHPKVTTVKPSPQISLGLSLIHNSLFFSFWVFPGCKAGNELAELVVRPLLQMKAASAAVRWLSANTRSLKKEAVAKVRVVDFLSVFLDLARRLWGGYYKQKQESLGNPRLLFTF